jgi:aspartyl-tRNA(Asn)/glutamyl-tRNA(Gln) amidotransferase subunit A
MESPRAPGVTRRDLLGGAVATVAVSALGAGSVAARPPVRSARRVSAGMLPDARAVAARTSNPADLDVLECVSLLRAGLLSSSELTDACLARTAGGRAVAINAWARVYADRARSDAAAADRRLTAARRRGLWGVSLLCGVPVGVKDIYDIAGLPMTAGSKILAGNVARTDAAAWHRLAAHGVVLLGHTQTHEFAAGNFTPQTGNPWDLTRTPGGSSGGSGAALAERMVPAALGSDTLGSLRIPASLCGVSAFKPTYGLVSTTGLVPLAPSFDHAGPMARGAGDVALLLEAMIDPRDALRTIQTSGRRLLRAPTAGSRPLAGLRIGVPRGSFGGVPVEDGPARVTAAFGTQLAALGATLVAFDAPVGGGADNLSSGAGLTFFSTVAGNEIDAYHRRWFPERASDYTSDVAFTLTLLRATNTVPPDPSVGRETIRALRRDWVAAFREHRVDAVLQPAAVIETPTRGDAMGSTQRIGDPMVVWDYLGFPALALPGGPSPVGHLPIGVQLAGLPGSEPVLARIGIDAQAHAPHHRRRPGD